MKTKSINDIIKTMDTLETKNISGIECKVYFAVSARDTQIVCFTTTLEEAIECIESEVEAYVDEQYGDRDWFRDWYSDHENFVSEWGLYNGASGVSSIASFVAHEVKSDRI